MQRDYPLDFVGKHKPLYCLACFQRQQMTTAKNDTYHGIQSLAKKEIKNGKNDFERS